MYFWCVKLGASYKPIFAFDKGCKFGFPGPLLGYNNSLEKLKELTRSCLTHNCGIGYKFGEVKIKAGKICMEKNVK